MMCVVLVAKKSVSVKWQIVFLFVSILNIWAFYRIQKLRKVFLFVYLPSIAMIVIMISLYMVDYATNIEKYCPYSPDHGMCTPSFQPSSSIYVELMYGFSLAFKGLEIYLVVYWSRKWNKQFSNRTFDEIK